MSHLLQLLDVLFGQSSIIIKAISWVQHHSFHLRMMQKRSSCSEASTGWQALTRCDSTLLLYITFYHMAEQNIYYSISEHQ